MIDSKKFRTQTVYRERPNGSLKDLWLIGIDIGYSSVKVYSNSSLAMFPSFAIRSSAETIGTPKNTHIRYRDLDTGETWIVGQSAQDGVSQDDAVISEEAVFGRQRYDDPMFKVLLRTGLGLGMVANPYGNPAGKTVHIQTGLPSKYLSSDQKYLRAAIAGHHRFALTVGSQKEIVYDISVSRDNIDIMDQPMGTLMSVSIDSLHKFLKSAIFYLNSNGIVLDGGFGTLDLFVVKNNSITGRQTFPEFSMRKVLVNTIERIREEFDEEISLIGIQKCLSTGMIRCHDKFSSVDRPFGDILEKESRRVCDEALEYIANIYSLYEYDYLIITGGTGAAWEAQIRDKLKQLSNLRIVNGNINDQDLPFAFANVRGYYEYLYTKLSKDVKEP